MAERMRQGQSDPSHHPYWIPLYPAILAAGLEVFRASSDSEIPALHLVYWLIFGSMAFGFAFLLQRLWDNLVTEEPGLAKDGWFFPAWSAACFAILWYYASQFLPIAAGNPDGVVALISFLAAAITVRIWSSNATYLWYVL